MAVLAHLKGQFEQETLLRAAALSTWADNPDVDHLIGKKLSQKVPLRRGRGLPAESPRTGSEVCRGAVSVGPGFTASGQ